ncbi:MAG TPA: phosphoribosylglycinamide formyltransferase, partial [Moorella mulderi]|nr:phosphoribosylglycinamide formyltransferase [Moorella mulderi]
MEAIAEAIEKRELPARINIVISDRAEAQALERARKRGLKTFFLNPRDFSTREEYDLALAQLCLQEGVELVVLAGFMRILTPAFLEKFPLRVIN